MISNDLKWCSNVNMNTGHVLKGHHVLCVCTVWGTSVCGPPREHTAVSTRVRSVSLYQYSAPLPNTGRELWTSSWTHSRQYEDSFSVPVSILGTTPSYRLRTVHLLVNTQPSVPGLIQCSCVDTQDHSLLQAENCGPPHEHTAVSTRARSVSLYQYSGPLPHTGRELWTS